GGDSVSPPEKRQRITHGTTGGIQSPGSVRKPTGTSDCSTSFSRLPWSSTLKFPHPCSGSSCSVSYARRNPYSGSGRRYTIQSLQRACCALNVPHPSGAVGGATPSQYPSGGS